MGGGFADLRRTGYHPAMRTCLRLVVVSMLTWMAVLPAQAQMPWLLNLVFRGTGQGEVSFAVNGITCTTATPCPPVSYGTIATLTAIPAPNSMFVGWSGACSGAGECRLEVGPPAYLEVTFDAFPTNHTGLWWNPSESGWGIGVSQQGDTVFATLFTYDSAGMPVWLVMPAGTRHTADEFSGDLYRTTGPAFNARPFTPIGPANVTRVGSMRLAFTSPGRGVLEYDFGGARVFKSIEKQVFGPRLATCVHTSASRASAINYQDLWWNPAESGWGVGITHQGDTLFATLFTYEGDGRGMWLVMPSGARQSDGSFSGALYRTRGPAFNASPWSAISTEQVGTMRLRFSTGESGTLEYNVGTVQVTKAISRQVFGSLLTSCS